MIRSVCCGKIVKAGHGRRGTVASWRAGMSAARPHYGGKTARATPSRGAAPVHPPISLRSCHLAQAGHLLVVSIMALSADLRATKDAFDLLDPGFFAGFLVLPGSLLKQGSADPTSRKAARPPRAVVLTSHAGLRMRRPRRGPR